MGIYLRDRMREARSVRRGVFFPPPETLPCEVCCKAMRPLEDAYCTRRSEVRDPTILEAMDLCAALCVDTCETCFRNIEAGLPFADYDSTPRALVPDFHEAPMTVKEYRMLDRPPLPPEKIQAAREKLDAALLEQVKVTPGIEKMVIMQRFREADVFPREWLRATAEREVNPGDVVYSSEQPMAQVGYVSIGPITFHGPPAPEPPSAHDLAVQAMRAEVEAQRLSTGDLRARRAAVEAEYERADAEADALEAQLLVLDEIIGDPDEDPDDEDDE